MKSPSLKVSSKMFDWSIRIGGGGETDRERGDGVFTKCAMPCTAFAVSSRVPQHVVMFFNVLFAERSMVASIEIKSGTIGRSNSSLR